MCGDCFIYERWTGVPILLCLHGDYGDKSSPKQCKLYSMTKLTCPCSSPKPLGQGCPLGTTWQDTHLGPESCRKTT